MNNHTDILIYQTEEGNTKVDVRLENETVWMTQKGIAELYQTATQNITLHINSVYAEGELNKSETTRKSKVIREIGNRIIEQEELFYNLELILAVGYRVDSHHGSYLRTWATKHLGDYLIKGFLVDDERLQDMRNYGEDYFDELLERIRAIRASEKIFYQKIIAVYASAVDYDPNTEITKELFTNIYNKLHFAIHGQTAAELIVERAKSENDNMGLTSWKGDRVRKKDVTVAKNYLTEKEIKSLNRIVTMYLDYAEDQAERQQPMYMSDWTEKLNAFLQFNEREILEDAGKIKKTVADKLAIEEYEKYNENKIRDNEMNDFDRFIESNDLKK